MSYRRSKMHIMRIKERDFKAIKSTFDNSLKETHEQLCFIGVIPSMWSWGKLFLVQEVHFLGHEDYMHQSAVYVEPRKEVQSKLFREILGKGFEVFTIHTHLGRIPFSPTDRESIIDVTQVLNGHIYGNVIFHNHFDYFSGRFYDPELQKIKYIDRLDVVGNGIELFLNDQSNPNQPEDENSERHRQYLIPGLIKRRIESARVAVIGLGGNGAPVLEHLACIGFGCGEGGKVFLIDDDIVEASNLARLPYASRKDKGKLKIDVALRYLKWKTPKAKVEALPMSVLKPYVLDKLKSCNIMFGCTDSESSRKVLNELSISCLIPYIDLGCGILPGEGSDYFSGGQVRTVLPGVGPCLVCVNGLDANQMARETYSEEEVNMRIKAGYIKGFDKNPTASILHLNTTVASQSISQAIKMIMGEDLLEQSYLFYDQRKSILKTVHSVIHPNCPVCGPGGILGSGIGFIRNTFERVENIPVNSNVSLVDCI
jgi:molybdopterin/thiamine biosynthesis adenylyltransferase